MDLPDIPKVNDSDATGTTVVAENEDIYSSWFRSVLAQINKFWREMNSVHTLIVMEIDPRNTSDDMITGT